MKLPKRTSAVENTAGNSIAKILEFPELAQTYGFDCGASAFQSILVYYGIEKREDELLDQLKENDADTLENGVKIKKIIEAAKYYGLDAELDTNSDSSKLRALIDAGYPAILLVQAWGSYTENPEWKKEYDNGHYVVVMGYQSNKFIFEDPISFNRVYLSEEELLERWHGYNDQDEKDPGHYAIIIKGEKSYDEDKLTHMD